MISEGRFRADDGVELAYTLRAGGHRRLFVVVPGILTDRRCAEHALLAERLADLGDVLSLDVRGHGDSGGAFSFGAREHQDVAALARELRDRYARLALVGFSFGGFHCLLAAARNPGLFDAVATVAAPAHLGVLFDHVPSGPGLLRSLPLMARRSRRPVRLGLPPLRPRSPLREVDRIAPVPLLLVHGMLDWLVPPSHARALHERARAPKRLVLIEGGVHAEYLLADDPDPLLAALRGFLAGV